MRHIRKGLIKRFAIPTVLAGAAVVLMGSAAMAAGPSAFQFGINGYDSYACTSQTQTASTMAPYIEVQLNSTSPFNNNNVNFTAADTNCNRLSGAQWINVSVGTGYQAIKVNDYQGQYIKLDGGTGTFEGATTVYGDWQY